ncbi:hypothetical protein [Natrinema salaciae]|uniref:Uncharacterized protein n=1 Tax=Natrinema salaciae TaxID=1186196 RepID=A0A1H9EUS2_9EURY|nr:hypothetical protein [Natrinema salaciae]SEQ28728.1 hypothetical protein SAMN04489841_1373 [Natrinema salaciae]
MIAGQFALLAEAATDPLENHHDQTGRALEVEETQTYLDDDLTIQSGMVAGEVPQEEERVLLDDHEIETETRNVKRRVASEWVADVDGEGWILAECTHTSDLEHEPDWPFNDFSRFAGPEIAPVRLKPWQFVRNQRDADREWSVEMTTYESNLNDTTIEWGHGALKSKATDADVGVALTTFWNDVHIRLVIYASGYLAIWEPDEMKPELLGRFIHEEIVPIATFADDAEVEEDQAAEQSTLEDSGAEA